MAAVAVTLLVLRGGFRRVEHVLLALSAVLRRVRAGRAARRARLGGRRHGLVVPEHAADRDAVLTATATVGTTLAPWGLAFIQSYAVDKRLTPPTSATSGST